MRVVNDVRLFLFNLMPLKGDLPMDIYYLSIGSRCITVFMMSNLNIYNRLTKPTVIS